MDLNPHDGKQAFTRPAVESVTSRGQGLEGAVGTPAAQGSLQVAGWGGGTRHQTPRLFRAFGATGLLNTPPLAHASPGAKMHRDRLKQTFFRRCVLQCCLSLESHSTSRRNSQ